MRFVAFLRAINVGGHVVKMEALRRFFASMGFAGVETFIASGNVVFESSERNEAVMARKIEEKLREHLGYEVVTFLRSEQELARIAAHEAFPPAKFQSASRLFIALLAAAPSKAAANRLTTHGGELDEFRIDGRELYWLCHTRVSDSEFSGAKLEKTIGLKTTVRNANTLRRLAARLSETVPRPKR